MINAKRHTEKLICYLMLYQGIIGCTDMKDRNNEVLAHCEAILNAQTDYKQRQKVLRRAHDAIAKMFDMVKDISGFIIIPAICLTLNAISERGYEVFEAGEPIADMFDAIVVKCEINAEAELISKKWLAILYNDEYFK